LSESPQIVIAGASGYIGKALIPKLLERFPNSSIVALSRSQQKSEDPRVKWKACDLFSLKSLEEALPLKADLALYLVHSMGPTAHLDQGSFADYDLLLADNFARMAKKMSIKHLIFLGGLVPETDTLSMHLKSRLEMEELFSEYEIPTTVFRAALILGKGGSSFQILLKLVERLPVMICPRWTQTLTTPVGLDTVLQAIVGSSLDPSHLGKIYDLAGCKPITYIEMMRRTARQMKKKRYFFTVPFFTPTLSRLWVSLITNSPKDLVYPLIESLEHPMVARSTHLYPKTSLNGSYDELLEEVSLKTVPGKSIFHFQPRRTTVRSVQRLRLPKGKNAEWVRNRYVQWLPHFLKPLIFVKQEGSLISFSVLNSRWVMLQLQISPDRSDVDRQLLYIVRGLLVAKDNRGRLEFRVVLNRTSIIAAVHDYSPSLPWFIYRHTQARAHLFVMRSFSRQLARMGTES
jgi:uncharacterized protein YbjT (DUF2867 family)